MTLASAGEQPLEVQSRRHRHGRAAAAEHGVRDAGCAVASAVEQRLAAGHVRPGGDAGEEEEHDASYDWRKGEARWSGDVKPERAGPVKLQPGDLDGMLMNLALVRDVGAGKPLNYRHGRGRQAKQLTLQGRRQGDGARSAASRSRRPRWCATDGDKQTIAWVVEGLPVPARILQRRDGTGPHRPAAAVGALRSRNTLRILRRKARQPAGFFVARSSR